MGVRIHTAKSDKPRTDLMLSIIKITFQILNQWLFEVESEPRIQLVINRSFPNIDHSEFDPRP